MKKLTKNYYDLIFCLLVLLLPFSLALPNILLGVLGAFFLLKIKNSDFKVFIKNPFVIFLLLYVYLIAKALISGTFLEDSSLYGRFAIVLAFPLLFQYIKNINWIKISFIFSMILAVLLSVIKITVYYVQHSILPIVDGAEVNNLLALERPYFGVMMVISAIVSFDLLKNYNNKKVYLLWLNIALMFFFILFISARMSFVTILILVVLYIAFYAALKIKYKVIILSVVFLFPVLVFFLNKNISQRFHFKNSITEMIQDNLKHEPRSIIWSCAKGITNYNFNSFFGKQGYAEISNELKECYGNAITNDNDKKEYFQERNFNSHNTFIDFYLIGGIIAFILFTGFLINLFCLSRSNFPFFAIIITLISFMFVENMLHRQLGCYLFGIFIILYKKINFEKSID